MSSWSTIEPSIWGDDRGSLGVLESANGLPFAVKRVFWVNGVPAGQTRGFHAHKTGHQILVCLAGGISARFFDGRNSEEHLLAPGGSAVWMRNMVWGEQTFIEPNSILLVLASNEFEESDYIRNRIEFEALSQKA